MQTLCVNCRRQSPGLTLSSGLGFSPDSSSPHHTLPPIITSEKDRNFLVSLNAYIDDELGRVDRHDPDQRYTVYKAAFDRIIDYVSAYKPLLTAIKAEYEDCIDNIQRGQQEAFYLSGKLKAVAAQPCTIYNFKKRSDELEHKLSIIRGDNARLQRELQELRAAREQRETLAKTRAEPAKKVEDQHDRRIIPGLTVQQSTDVKTLTNKLEKVERQLRDLGISHRTRYTSKTYQKDLKEQLAEKVQHRDDLVDHTAMLKARSQKLKVAVEAAQNYLEMQPPHQTIGDAVVQALVKADQQFSLDRPGADEDPGSPAAFEHDDPSQEKEAEMMLDYIERFNELLEEQKYEEAAIHAANSPKGILRTRDTLNRFQALSHTETAHQSLHERNPLLAFCDALMSTVPCYGTRPDWYMSERCVKCALEENRLDLLSHWISQDRLTMTQGLGDMIYKYCQHMPEGRKPYLALAQQVYAEVNDAGCHMQGVMCMMQQGRVKQGLDYAQHRARFRPVDYMKVLEQCPSPQLAQALWECKPVGQSLLPLGVIVTTLLRTEAEDMSLHFLQNICSQTAQAVPPESSPLSQAIFADSVTSHEEWLDIVEACNRHGHSDIGIDILAATTVLQAVDSARKRTRHLEDSAQNQQVSEMTEEGLCRSEEEQLGVDEMAETADASRD